MNLHTNYEKKNPLASSLHDVRQVFSQCCQHPVKTFQLISFQIYRMGGAFQVHEYLLQLQPSPQGVIK